jgi:hypothetical protein
MEERRQYSEYNEIMSVPAETPDLAEAGFRDLSDMDNQDEDKANGYKFRTLYKKKVPGFFCFTRCAGIHGL